MNTLFDGVPDLRPLRSVHLRLNRSGFSLRGAVLFAKPEDGR